MNMRKHITYLTALLLIFSSYLSAQSSDLYRFEGYFENWGGGRKLELIAKFLPENPIVFEAGGHYGTDTVRMSQQWQKGKIVSFEPNPHAYELYQENTKNCSNVTGYPLAVSDYNGTATLYVCYGTTGDDPIFEGASSLLEASEGMKIHYQGPEVEVPCVILDDWCEENGIDHFDFMWLDLEGLELQTLQASPKILDHVKVIHTETNFYKFRQGTTQYDYLKHFLESAGFKLLAHWYHQGYQGDAIFVREELFDQVVRGTSKQYTQSN